MDGLSGLLKEFTGGSGGSSRGGGGNETQKRAGYIFTALVVPFIFSKIIKPVRTRLRIFLSDEYKRNYRRGGKRSNRAKLCRFMLDHLDLVTSKEALFSFYLALLVFLRTVIPHFKTVARGLAKNLR